MSLVPGRACPLLPAWPFWCVLRHLLPSSAAKCCAVGAALTRSLCSRAGWDPSCHGTRPSPTPCWASCPSAAARLPPKAAGHWMPGLPALPGEAGAGKGAEMAGGGQRAAGRGKAERADCRARAASGTLFLATRSPGVLSFTHLFTPGPRGRRGTAFPRGAEHRGGGSQPDLLPLGAKGGG